MDAGPYGWGGRLQRTHPAQSGSWSAAEAEMHITWRELRAVRLFILQRTNVSKEKSRAEPASLRESRTEAAVSCCCKDASER